MNFPIRAKKLNPTDPRYMRICELDDPAAAQFEIPYYVHQCGWSSEITLPTKYLAENVQAAMQSAFESGRKAAFSELRNLIGVKAR